MYFQPALGQFVQFLHVFSGIYICFRLLVKIHSCTRRYQSKSQIYKGDPRPCVPIHVMALSVLGSNWGSLGFYRPHTQKQTGPRPLCTMRHLTHFYLHAQTAVDAGDICTRRTRVILITGQTPETPNLSPCWAKNGAGSGISRLYL